MATLYVLTDWTLLDGGVGYWQIEDDFIVGGSTSACVGDITTYVKSYSLDRGRSSETDRVAPGNLTLVLDNAFGRFTPLNTNSALSGCLVPGREIRVLWTLGGSTFNRFRGRTVTFTPEPTVGKQREATIECADDMERFQRRETRSTLYQNIKSGCLISGVLDDAQFPAASSGSRSLDTGQDTYEFAHFDRRKVDEVLVDIVRTEYGFLFIRGDGSIIYHDRYFRQINSTASATFNENMTRATFSRSANDLYTEARVTTLPKVTKASATIWTLQTAITIGPSSTASWFGNYIDPTTCQLAIGGGVASPVIGTGILMNSNASGTGTNLSTSLTASFTAFAESFKIVASNAGATTGYIWSMTVTGSPIVNYENVGRNWIDTTACGLYGLRTLTYDAPLLSDPDKGQAFAQFLVNRYSSPSNIDRVTISIVNDDTTNWEHILRRDLDSKLTVTCQSLALNADGFFVGRLNESWNSSVGIHEAEYTLERLGVSDQLFIIDLSVVDGSAGFGY